MRVFCEFCDALRSFYDRLLARRGLAICELPYAAVCPPICANVMKCPAGSLTPISRAP